MSAAARAGGKLYLFSKFVLPLVILGAALAMLADAWDGKGAGLAMQGAGLALLAIGMHRDPLDLRVPVARVFGAGASAPQLTTLKLSALGLVMAGGLVRLAEYLLN